MSTSDGISTEDWNAVHELVLSIANAEAEAEENIFTNQLLQVLDELEGRYGALPSILATRADYVSDVSEQAVLFKQAYALAESSNDIRNLKLISHSLAELYIRELKDPSEGRVWLKRLEAQIQFSPDEDMAAELGRLRQILGELTIQ
jgi:hypothetical protein